MSDDLKKRLRLPVAADKHLDGGAIFSINADRAAAADRIEELEAELARAMGGLEDALGVGMAYSDGRLGYDGAISLLNRLKGERDDHT